MPKTFDVRPIDAPEGWKKLPVHPLADLTEFGQGIDLAAVAAKMKAHGYDESEPIVLIVHEGKMYILDGRHRRAAAARAGVEPTFVLYVGDNPRMFVYKKYLRQHLSVTQRSILADIFLVPDLPQNGQPAAPAIFAAPAAKISSPYTDDPKQGRGRPSKGHAPVEEAARLAGVSPDSIVRVGSVRVSGCPQLQWLLRIEKISMSRAAEIAEFDEPTQKKALAPWFCERCLRTGAMSEDCASCQRLRAKITGKMPPAPTKLSGRGEPVYDHTTFRELLGKALAEADKLARQHGHIRHDGTTDERTDLRAIRELLRDALATMEAWKKRLTKDQTPCPG